MKTNDNYIISDTKPENIIRHSSSLYTISYDIEEFNDNEQTLYKYKQITFTDDLNYKTVTKKLIRAKISEDEEFDLINSYNKSIINNDTTYDKSKYVEYLNLLDNIKSYVKKILSEYVPVKEEKTEVKNPFFGFNIHKIEVPNETVEENSNDLDEPEINE